MCAKALGDRIALADSNNAARISFVPDHVHACTLNAVEIQALKIAPMSIVTARRPVQLQHFASRSLATIEHASDVTVAGVFNRELLLLVVVVVQ